LKQIKDETLEYVISDLYNPNMVELVSNYLYNMLKSIEFYHNGVIIGYGNNYSTVHIWRF
jgi:hypothetical protein